jgi:hypothetical protein
MNNIFPKAGFIVLLSVSAFISCRKKDNPSTVATATTYGTMAMRVTDMAGTGPLVLNTQAYVTAHKDTLTISRFNYYMSNIVLIGAGGKNYAESNSFHLVKMEDSTTFNYTLDSIPTGTYSSLTFQIGVDSAHNVDGAQTGGLDPIKGMYWDWNQGFIMAKMEGTSPQSYATGNAVTYHIGGYAGLDNALRTVTLTFPQPLTISKNITAHSYLHADALKWFYGAHVIDIAITHTVMSVTGYSSEIADNYANMFAVDSMSNK